MLCLQKNIFSVNLLKISTFHKEREEDDEQNIAEKKETVKYGKSNLSMHSAFMDLSSENKTPRDFHKLSILMTREIYYLSES